MAATEIRNIVDRERNRTQSLPPKQQAQSNQSYNFGRPASQEGFITDPFLKALMATAAFRRLRSIRFLGAIDFRLGRAFEGKKENIRYSRYQHSLGVARLASLYSNIRELSLESRRLVTAAALLHDIGHAPLSHSLEPVFREYFDLEHHKATYAIISGKVKLGAEVYQTLREYKIDIERLLLLVSGKDQSFDGFFGGPINFDTIEAILRSRRYMRSNALDLDPVRVVEAATLRANSSHERIVDNFWMLKNDVYQNMIGSEAGIIADYASQQFMRQHIEEFSKDDFYITEREFFLKAPQLYKILTAPVFEVKFLTKHDSISTQPLRAFSIDKRYDFFARADKGRYQQIRKNYKFSIKRDKNSPLELKLEFLVNGCLWR